MVLPLTLAVQPTCKGSSCTIDGGSGASSVYRVDAVDRAAPTADQAASRFFLQSSYGPTRATVKGFSTRAKWIKAQMALPMTSHREYFRQRANPRHLVSTQVGTCIDACEVGSRWHRFSFNQRDKLETLTVTQDLPNVYSLKVNNVVRTEVKSWADKAAAATVDNAFSKSYQICELFDQLDLPMLLTNSSKCKGFSKTRIADGTDMQFNNPPVSFTNVDATTTHDLSTATFEEVPHIPDVLVLKKLAKPCSKFATQHIGAFMKKGASFYKYDRRLKLVRNTLEQPSTQPVLDNTLEVIEKNKVSRFESSCPVAIRTFLNAPHCRVATTCAAPVFSSVMINLNSTVLRDWYTKSGKFAYYVTGLSAATTPCEGVSRWKQLSPNKLCAAAGKTETALDAATKKSLVDLLVATSDKGNAFVRDIGTALKTVVGCSTKYGGVETIGATVSADGGCWQHTNVDEYSVHDFSYWVLTHNGNEEARKAGRPNPIKRFAEKGSVNIKFPSHHAASRWTSKKVWLPFMGRFGDKVDFGALPTSTQTVEMAAQIGALGTRPDAGIESCGSPSEAANMPALGNLYWYMKEQMGDSNTAYRRELDFPSYEQTAKSTLWYSISLKAKDQLRQRVAWSLLQVVVVGQEGTTRSDEVEPWAVYYDILLRNGLGTYRDILKEVSYSPLMGEYLTSKGNKGFSFAKTFPDENYAREIMQLFSIGLWRLNDDGTRMKGKDGKYLQSYDNDDIATFARVWTGFDRQPARGNVEAPNNLNSFNAFDPMMIKAQWHDRLPKTKLDSGYLGDHHPLCVDLPPRQFLQKGARYKLLSVQSAEGKSFDNAADKAGVGPHHVRFAPDPAKSKLYAKLCNRPAAGKACVFATHIALGATIACDGTECDVDNIRSVRIVDGGKSTWYEYVQPPCVKLTFFSGGKTTRSERPGGGGNRIYHQCADPGLPSATTTCCDPAVMKDASHKLNKFPWVTADATGKWIKSSTIKYAEERVTYSTAQARCAKVGRVLCPNLAGWKHWGDAYFAAGSDNMYSWMDKTCQVQIQVQPNGWIGIIDTPTESDPVPNPQFTKNTPDTFRIRWDGGAFPKQGACGAGCKAEGATCICDIKVEDKAGFTDKAKLPTLEAARAALFAGAAGAPGAGYDWVATYGYKVHMKGDVLDKDSVFELPPTVLGGKKRFVKNTVSAVAVGAFTFRNPPHFMPLLGERLDQVGHFTSSVALSAVEAEIESLLDHLFEHGSTGPFLAHRLIQRLVSSNPSPRYVKAAVTAFRTGAYGGTTYTGKYGDMGAMVAAILQDREASSPTLDADPHHGKLREPLLKLMHVLRAMEYKSFAGREVDMPAVGNFIGQAPYESPGVFNFFLPEYVPAGAAAEAGLVAPEAELETAPMMIGFMNGMTSLTYLGLTSAWMGLAPNLVRGYPGSGRSQPLDKSADGNLTFAPDFTSGRPATTPARAASVINELDTLLTDGRLSKGDKKVITDAYVASFKAPIGALWKMGIRSDQAALVQAIKLITVSAAFHSTALSLDNGLARVVTSGVTSLNRPFKAVVVLFLHGGADSYNMLIPHSGCTGKSTGVVRDLYAEYAKVRTNAAISFAELKDTTIKPKSGSQPCGTFALHPQLKFLKSLYDGGEMSAVANIGALVEPVTATEVKKKSKQLPPSLFAHNIQQRCARSLHAQLNSAKGVMGRIATALSEQAKPYFSQLVGLTGKNKILEGGKNSPPILVNPSRGIARDSQYNLYKDEYAKLTGTHSDSVFAETYKSDLAETLSSTEKLGETLEKTTVSSISWDTLGGESKLGGQLKMTAKMIKLGVQMKSERGFYYTDLGGFDTHSNVKDTVDSKMKEMDACVKAFVDELKAQGLWDSVTIVTASDFARTLTSNGLGTDHAWGGNNFVIGGAVNGGQILGKFPPSLLEESNPQTVGRGRLVPTTPWEGIWNGVAKWMGVEDAQIAEVLPNAKNFKEGETLFTQKQMFSK